jgi:hypothetical protein
LRSLFSRKFRLCLGSAFLLACGSTASIAQTQVEEKYELNHDIRCIIQTELPQWNLTTPAVVSGTIENLTDGPLEVEVDPELNLSSRTSSEMRDRFWAPVDLFHDRPQDTDRRALDAGGKAIGINTRPILLQFKNKGDKIDFRVDAQHLLWAREISSVWPDSALFSTVNSDDYDLQLVLETGTGRVESPKVKISIDANKPLDKQQSYDSRQQRSDVEPSKETFQSFSRALFPNAPEKTQGVGCFRTLKPKMSMYTVVRKCGRPDEEVGSGIYIFVWDLADGSTVSIEAPTLQRIDDVSYTDPSGKTSSLLHNK